MSRAVRAAAVRTVGRRAGAGGPVTAAAARRPVAAAVAGVLAAATLAAQPSARPAPDVHYWVLPADRQAVEVARLHPNDCYVIQEADGLAYFGAPTDALRTLQDRLPAPFARRVEPHGAHTACGLGICTEIAGIAAALEREMASADPRLLRRADHRPTPVDRWFGGAYTDVGSEDRETFRRTPEQRMVFHHLATARRGNCYRAKAPRTLTVHVRDQGRRAHRTGVYHGFLYVEHHHPETTGAAAED